MSEESEKAFLAGNEEFVNQNWSVALDHFNRALELEPGRVEFLLHKAAALTKMGSLAEAVTTCETAIEKEPHNAKAYLRLGMALVQKGDLAAARKVLEHGQELDPKNKSFAPQIKKCGDAGLEAGPVAGNLERGKHDAALEAMLEAHGQQGYALLDTTMHFLQRKTPFFNMAPPIPADMIKVLASHYSSAGSAASGAAPSEASQAAAPPPRVGENDMRELPVKVSASAKKAWDKAIETRDADIAEALAEPGGIKIGCTCKNNACQKTYAGPDSLTQACLYHPGAPVFHEGYKYWSCCKKKKATEFSEFLNFAGCTQGTCLFVDDPTKRKKALCRYDFFQQGQTVCLSVYAKKVDPEECKVRLSATTLSLSLTFDFINTFTLDVALMGRVNPARCTVEILGPKVEITLSKADGTSWSELGQLLSPE